MNRILKYNLAPHGVTRLKLPHDAVFRHVAFQKFSSYEAGSGGQYERLQLWAESNIPDAPVLIERTFTIVRDGEEFTPDIGDFIGTAITADGSYVVHVFVL